MEILLLGELSGVHQELRRSLAEQGHQVTCAHMGGPYAQFLSDVPFRYPDGAGRGRFARAGDIFYQLMQVRRLTGYDIVQIITPKFFNWRIHLPLMRFLKRRNGALVLVTTSCSSDFNRAARTFRYSPCFDCKALDLADNACLFERPNERALEHAMYDLADAIVATQWEYETGLRNTAFAGKLVRIQLPIDLSRHRFRDAGANDPIRIYYGETRHGFKGGRPITAALDALAIGSLAARVEIKRCGRLSFDDYVAMLDEADIVIDQANSYSMGMNALYAMARGKAVLSGAEPESAYFLDIAPEDLPVINITPESADIYRRLTELIEAPARLMEMKRRARAFIERFHDSDRIAALYCELYEQLLDRRDISGSASRERVNGARAGRLSSMAEFD